MSFYANMDVFSAFSDLPQIQLEQHGSQYSNVPWPGYGTDYETVLDDGYSFGTCELPTARTVLHPSDTRENSLRRFMSDPSPWTPPGLSPGQLSATTDNSIFRHPGFNPQYESNFPSMYYPRQSSPAETSRSNSSASTRNPSQNDDLYSPHSAFRGIHLEVHSEAIPDFTPLSVRSPQLSPGGGSGIALREIQGFPDTETEPAIEEFPLVEPADESVCEDNICVRPRVNRQREHYPQGRGNQRLDHRIREAESVQPCSPPAMHDDEADDPDYKPSSPSSLSGKRRRRQPSQSSTGYTTRSPIKKGSVHRRKTSGSSANSNGVSKSRRLSNGHNVNGGSGEIRPFPCPLAGYKCQSTFASKNEWKRHVSTQHVRLGYWRCDLCPQPSNDGTFNDFNRKDLFTQHLRRMHTQKLLEKASKTKKSVSLKNSNKDSNAIPDDVMMNMQQRCYQELRTAPPQSECLFCPRTFTNWDERMEHVGSHFERERKSGKAATSPENWRDDAVLRDWLIEEGLIEQAGKGDFKIGNGIPLRHTC